MHPTKRLLLPTTLALLLAACASAAPPTPPPSELPSDVPSDVPAPSEPPADELFVHGTLDVIEGVAIDGPGVNLRTALLTSDGVPLLVNGALVRDPDGSLFLCETIDLSAPALCGGLNMEVVHYPEDAALWDPANAGDTGLRQAGDILYFERMQLYGAVTARG